MHCEIGRFQTSSIRDGSTDGTVQLVIFKHSDNSVAGTYEAFIVPSEQPQRGSEYFSSQPRHKQSRYVPTSSLPVSGQWSYITRASPEMNKPVKQQQADAFIAQTEGFLNGCNRWLLASGYSPLDKGECIEALRRMLTEPTVNETLDEKTLQRKIDELKGHLYDQRGVSESQEVYRPALVA